MQALFVAPSPLNVAKSVRCVVCRSTCVRSRGGNITMMAKKRVPKSKVEHNKPNNPTSSGTPPATDEAPVPTEGGFAPREPPIDEQFIPRGPTLREEYERKGIIKPDALSPDAGVLPQEVADRMIRRILAFGGVPLSLLFTFFAVYFVLKYKYDITVLPVVVATSTLGTVGMAALGITYGIFSSSWDEEQGSLLGIQEAKQNLIRARDGLVGTREREKREDELAKLDAMVDEFDD